MQMAYHSTKPLGLLFFINWFTDIFTEDLGTDGEIKIKIKYTTSTKHLIKMEFNIFCNSKTEKDSNITKIRDLWVY